MGVLLRLCEASNMEVSLLSRAFGLHGRILQSELAASLEVG
jgi:hypothetical protein